MNPTTESRVLAEAIFQRAEALGRRRIYPEYYIIGTLQAELTLALDAAPAEYRKSVAQRLAKSSTPVTP